MSVRTSVIAFFPYIFSHFTATKPTSIDTAAKPIDASLVSGRLYMVYLNCKRITVKLLIALFFLFSDTLLTAESKEAPMRIYDFTVKNIRGEDISLSRYRGKVLLIVNVASECGFTPQYEGLEALYEQYKDRGFMVLGFPSNQFAGQEPGSNKEIYAFCTGTYNVQFDMFAKIDVNGDNTAPLFRYLKKEATGLLWTESIKWNFTKFLVDRNGKVVMRYGSSTKPDSIAPDIEVLLKE